jgi:DNA-nicking Smr family endonuclease
MNRRKREGSKDVRQSSRQHIAPHGFYTPFKELDQLFPPIFSKGRKDGGGKIDRYAEKPPAPRLSTGIQPDDDSLFRAEMADVAPLPGGSHKIIPRTTSGRDTPRFLAQEQIEAYTELVDLVAGQGPFELSYSDEYIDGAVLGISPEVLKKLREGYFSYQECLDLHGLNRLQARSEVKDFVTECFALRRRCVLIIAGRGLNSKDKEPVLKNNLPIWLTRSPLKRMILAFASARSYDGGWGAFYVLLRKNEGKAPLIMPAR